MFWLRLRLAAWKGSQCNVSNFGTRKHACTCVLCSSFSFKNVNNVNKLVLWSFRLLLDSVLGVSEGLLQGGEVGVEEL